MKDGGYGALDAGSVMFATATAREGGGNNEVVPSKSWSESSEAEDTDDGASDGENDDCACARAFLSP
eukprot:CAMPEP_0178706954 /NCGR_PEP_ID=MMETSP0699-20121125/15713_1 /TAXON_ID=265572 /ORGANISM="Extubocellulus spinifer, Strain CCMP396" /LENGTH=66 /DNA_ID=CAMNT_0020354851 /DNA_START=610 /DNA_END=811 /DNA_ORIENTATION=+